MKPEAIALKKLYENEYDQWLEEMVSRLKNRQLDELDYDHLIEELEALGRSERSAVKSLLLQIIIHLLLYQYSSSHPSKTHLSFPRKRESRATFISCTSLIWKTLYWQSEQERNANHWAG